MAKLVAVRVTEGDLSEGSSSSRVVDDIFHNTADITMALTVVEGSEFGRVLSNFGVSINGYGIWSTGRIVPFAAWCGQLFDGLAPIFLYSNKCKVSGTY